MPRGRSKLSNPQFLQGFVDGALQQERHLIWERLFSIQDDTEAARFCQENLHSGFFDAGDDTGNRATADEPDGEDDVRSMLSGLFAPAGQDFSSSRSTRSAQLPTSGAASLAPSSQTVIQKKTPHTAYVSIKRVARPEMILAKQYSQVNHKQK